MKYWDEYVCLSVREDISQEPHVRSSPIFFLHVAYARGSVRVPTNLENLELSGNFVNLEKSGNLRCGQGIFYDMSHGSRLP